MNVSNPCASWAACVAWLVALLPASAGAESLGLAASSASSAGSASVASISDSVQGSSRSSAGDRTVAEGDYRVVRVVELDGTPERLQLHLERLPADRGTAAADDDLIRLRVPAAALGARGMAVGELVQVRHRPYGLEFARPAQAGGREPFLLALTEEWQREMGSRALGR